MPVERHIYDLIPNLPQKGSILDLGAREFFLVLRVIPWYGDFRLLSTTKRKENKGRC